MSALLLNLEGLPEPFFLALDGRLHTALQSLPGKDDEQKVFFALRVARDFAIKSGRREAMKENESELESLGKLPGKDTRDKLTRAIIDAVLITERAKQIEWSKRVEEKKKRLIWTPEGVDS